MDFSEFLAFLERRSSVRDYAADPLGHKEIQNILQAARSAPSAGNRESWDVVVVTDSEIREELASAALEQQHIARAPVVLVICANYVRAMSRYGERGILYAVQDATIACTYMMLAAHAQLLSSCWTGAFDEASVKEILGLPPHIRPIALLPIGRGKAPAEKTGRIPLEEHVHYDSW
jgi:nitroreductase